jgi:hypothetical protein
MSAPVDDFDLDIRLGAVEMTGFDGSADAAARTESASICPTYCRSYCMTNCTASDCVCV